MNTNSGHVNEKISRRQSLTSIKVGMFRFRFAYLTYYLNKLEACISAPYLKDGICLL